MILTQAIRNEVAFWNKEFDKAKQLREPFEKQWLINLAFYYGKQYVVWTPSAASMSNQTLTEPPVPKHRVRIVANRIKPMIRREHAKFSKHEPQWYVNPATAEPEDVASAKIGEELAKYYINHLNYNNVRRSATFWMLICGTSFMKTYANSSIDPKTGMVSASLAMDAITPWHMYVPQLQEEILDKQPFVIHGRAVLTETIESTYNIKVKGDTIGSTPLLETKLNNALGIKTTQNEQSKDMCFAKEIWVNPCKKYPDGGMLILVNEQLVHVYSDPNDAMESPSMDIAEGETNKWSDTAMPFKHGQYPFAKIDHIISGRFYGISNIEDIISLQVEYNKTRSQIVEAKNRMARPQRYYTKGSIDARKVTSEPGLLIPVNPGFNNPASVDLPSLPGYVLQEQDRTTHDMDENTGQNDIMRGRVPPGVHAASAIAYIQEESDSILHATIVSIEDATERLGRQILSNVQQYIPNDEIIKIVSRNNSIELEQFQHVDIKTDVDLRVEAGSMAPRSTAGRQALITELVKMGIIPPDKALQYMQMSETSRLWDELQADDKAATRENYLMAKGVGLQPTTDPNTGQPVIDPNTGIPAAPDHFPLNVWDNNIAHEYRHGLFLKSQEFELIQDPNIKEAFVQHYIATKQEIMSQNLAATQTQQGAPVGLPTS